MDLRNKNLSSDDIEQAKRLIAEKQFWYQPFTFSDTLEVGEGQNFCDRYEKLANVYWEGSDILVQSDCLPEDPSHFRECNGKLRRLYEYYLDVLVNHLSGDIHNLEFAEIGCNSGYFLHGLALRGARNCKGYDMGNFKQAFEWFNHVLDIRNEFYHAEWDKLNHCLNYVDFPMVDVTLTAHVLVHLPDPIHHLAYLCDHTRKAIFILTFVNKHTDLSLSFGHPSKYIHDLAYPLNFDNGVAFSIPLLELALKQSGFGKMVQIDIPEDLNDVWNEDFGCQVFDFPIEGRAFIAFRTEDTRTALSKGNNCQLNDDKSTINDFSEPRLVNAYLNYNLVRYKDHIYGLPQSIGEVHLPDKTEEECLSFIHGISEEEVKTLVLQEVAINSEFLIPISSFEIKSYSLEELEHYYHCLSTGVPYFGRVMRALQGLPLRHAYMQTMVRFVSQSIQDLSFEILEIGSWAGGSAITWAEAIKKFHAGKGRVTCIDAWIPYFDGAEELADLSEEARMHYQEMTDALVDDKIYKLFCHNIKAAGHDDIVAAFRGMSSDRLSDFKAEAFNLVFIDGDHRYSLVLADIQQALRLVADGGIICGDDLELQLHQVDIENARKHGDADYIIDPLTHQFFHPGVTLAVAEVFGEVSSWDGFWAMQKQADHWQQVDLSSLGEVDRTNIPAHLTNYYPTPQLVESINAHNIVAWRGRYYGLPQSLGPIDLSTKRQSELEELEGVLSENSLTSVKRKILDCSVNLVENATPPDNLQEAFLRDKIMLTQSQDLVRRLESSQLVLESQLEEIQNQLRQCRVELNQAQDSIRWMESSKFWKLRDVWMRIKTLVS